MGVTTRLHGSHIRAMHASGQAQAMMMMVVVVAQLVFDGAHLPGGTKMRVNFFLMLQRDV